MRGQIKLEGILGQVVIRGSKIADEFTSNDAEKSPVAKSGVTQQNVNA